MNKKIMTLIIVAALFTFRVSAAPFSAKEVANSLMNESSVSNVSVYTEQKIYTDVYDYFETDVVELTYKKYISAQVFIGDEVCVKSALYFNEESVTDRQLLLEKVNGFNNLWHYEDLLGQNRNVMFLDTEDGYISVITLNVPSDFFKTNLDNFTSFIIFNLDEIYDSFVGQ